MKETGRLEEEGGRRVQLLRKAALEEKLKFRVKLFSQSPDPLFQPSPDCFLLYFH